MMKERKSKKEQGNKGDLTAAVEEKAINLDACIKCGACTAECPVAFNYPPFPGPKRVGPDEERFRREGLELDPELLNYCSGCRTCELTCPSGVRVTDIIMRAKGKGNYEISPTRDRGRRKRVRDLVLGRAEYLGNLGTIWPGLTNAVLKTKAGRWLLEKGLGVNRHAPLPAYHRKLKLSRVSREPAPAFGQEQGSKRVILFPGCFIKYNDPATGELIVKVLRRNGYEVILPAFHCCGMPLEGNGYFSRAEDNGRYNLKLMAPYLAEGIPVVSACTSCSLALKEAYPQLGVPGAGRIGRQAYDLFEFLWELAEKGELVRDFQEVPAVLGYHAPCHLKAQGIGTPAVRLLRNIPGVKIIDLNTGCCGLSGSYGFKAEKYALGMKIGNPLFAAVGTAQRQWGITGMLTECGGCRVQIKHGTRVETEHPVRILARAYGLEPLNAKPADKKMKNSFNFENNIAKNI